VVWLASLVVELEFLLWLNFLAPIAAASFFVYRNLVTFWDVQNKKDRADSGIGS
jgi:hypothetical protein